MRDTSKKQSHLKLTALKPSPNLFIIQLQYRLRTLKAIAIPRLYL